MDSPGPTRRLAPRNWSKAFVLLGIVAIVVGIAGGVGGVAMVVRSVNGFVDAARQSGGALATVAAGATSTVTLQANTTYGLWCVTGGRLCESDPQVLDPTGHEVAVGWDRSTAAEVLNTPRHATSGLGPDVPSVLYGWAFTTGAAGPYEIVAAERSTGRADYRAIMVMPGITQMVVQHGGAGRVVTLAAAVVGASGPALVIWGTVLRRRHKTMGTVPGPTPPEAPHDAVA